MNDLVDRLRTGFDWGKPANCVASLMQYCDLTDEAADEIEQLRQRLHEVGLDWQVKHDEIERLEKELAMFKDAVGHCTDPNYTKRSTTASDGWTMISSEFYFDLVMAYNDTALKEYRKQVLLEAADIDWWDKDVAVELRKMAEE